MANLREKLRAFFSETSTLRLARMAPATLLAGSTGIALAALIGVPGFAATAGGILIGGLAINITSTWLEKLVMLPLENSAERETLIQQGLAAGDPGMAQLVAAILLQSGHELARALPEEQRDTIIAGLEQAMQTTGGALADLAPGYAAALHNPQTADWLALQAILERRPGVSSVIEAGEEGLIQNSGHYIDQPPGPVETSTRTGTQGQVIGSPIVIRGSGAGRRCPDCGTPVSADAVSCQGCGAPLHPHS
jgi:hypothetical protein